MLVRKVKGCRSVGDGIVREVPTPRGPVVHILFERKGGRWSIISGLNIVRLVIEACLSKRAGSDVIAESMSAEAVFFVSG